MKILSNPILYLLLVLLCLPVFDTMAQMSPRMPSMPSPPKINIKNPFPNQFNHFNYYNSFKLPSPPKYEQHKGMVFFSSGNKFTGDFKVKKKTIWFSCAENQQKYDFQPNMFQKIVLNGASKKVLYRKDSTEIFYIKKFDNFFRKIAHSKYEAFDNSFIIDENTNLPLDYYRIIKKTDTSYIKLDKFSDFGHFFENKDYFIQTDAILSQNNEDNKNEVILEDWFNLIYSDSIPNNLGWKSIKIYLKTGETIEGIGMIQPISYAATYSTINRLAHVHLYKNGNFYIYKNQEVDSLVLNKRTYVPQYLKKFDRYCFASSWDYYGKKYLVTRIYDSSNEMFFKTFDYSKPEKKEEYKVKRSYFIYNKYNEGNEYLFLEINGEKIKKAAKQDELSFEFNLK